MSKLPTEPRRVILVIPTNGIDGRARMRGIFRYLNDHPTWDTVLITTRTEAAGGRLAREIATGCDGLIISAEPDIYDVISSTLAVRRPTVIANESLLRLSDRSPHCRAVILDDEEIGATSTALDEYSKCKIYKNAKGVLFITRTDTSTRQESV